MPAMKETTRYYCLHCERELENISGPSRRQDTISGDEDLKTGKVLLTHDQCGHEVAFSKRNVANG